ncbi:hypothetical protein EDD15DRAFT_39893 [Pisolithus albus]|nr:hypothetical protein EDD15DRAFT_39893 [Pisolithus albus]
MPPPPMSEDNRSNQARGRRVLVLSNPDPGDSSSSEDERRRVYRQPQASYSSLHQPSPSGVPPSPYRPLKPGPPTPLTTDLPRHITSSHSNPTLSSPSSQSSNAVESTPPPSTPGQAVPPDIAAPMFTHDDGSSVNERAEVHQPNRLPKFPGKFWKSRRPSSNRPVEPDALVNSSSSRLPNPKSQERVILVTALPLSGSEFSPSSKYLTRISRRSLLFIGHRPRGRRRQPKISRVPSASASARVFLDYFSSIANASASVCLRAPCSSIETLQVLS